MHMGGRKGRVHVMLLPQHLHVNSDLHTLLNYHYSSEYKVLTDDEERREHFC